MQTQDHSTDDDLRINEVKSDYARVAMLVTGLVLALAGFVGYMGDVVATLT